MELIEREQQLKKLADTRNQVRAGKGYIALVSGEALEKLRRCSFHDDRSSTDLEDLPLGYWFTAVSA
ncbi:MAG: hypothetical protein AB1649_08355 [Chloroflexota bacterium]